MAVAPWSSTTRILILVERSPGANGPPTAAPVTPVVRLWHRGGRARAAGSPSPGPAAPASFWAVFAPSGSARSRRPAVLAIDLGSHVRAAGEARGSDGYPPTRCR